MLFPLLSSVKKRTLMEVYVTDTIRGMEKTGEIKATDGSFKLNLPPAAMITLISK
jgi:hypothetical protein